MKSFVSSQGSYYCLGLFHVSLEELSSQVLFIIESLPIKGVPGFAAQGKQ